MGPSRPWKHKVCCFLLYQLMIRFLSVLLNCFMLPPGDDHFPCCCKLHFTKFFNESKLLVQVNQSPFNWRCCKSKLSRLGKNGSILASSDWFSSELESVQPSAMIPGPDHAQLWWPFRSLNYRFEIPLRSVYWNLPLNCIAVKDDSLLVRMNVSGIVTRAEKISLFFSVPESVVVWDCPIYFLSWLSRQTFQNPEHRYSAVGIFSSADPCMPSVDFFVS